MFGAGESPQKGPRRNPAKRFRWGEEEATDAQSLPTRASIAFVWSPAKPPPAFRLFAGRCPTPHFYEVLVCTHTDREHIHSHFLINSVNFDTGKKLHVAKEQLQELRQRNDQICMEFSLPVFNPANKKEKTKTMAIGEYHTAVRGQSVERQILGSINRTFLEPQK